MPFQHVDGPATLDGILAATRIAGHLPLHFSSRNYRNRLATYRVLLREEQPELLPTSRVKQCGLSPFTSRSCSLHLQAEQHSGRTPTMDQFRHSDGARLATLYQVLNGRCRDAIAVFFCFCIRALRFSSCICRIRPQERTCLPVYFPTIAIRHLPITAIERPRKPRGR